VANVLQKTLQFLRRKRPDLNAELLKVLGFKTRTLEVC
jgi:hypothetical protein